MQLLTTKEQGQSNSSNKMFLPRFWYHPWHPSCWWHSCPCLCPFSCSSSWISTFCRCRSSRKQLVQQQQTQWRRWPMMALCRQKQTRKLNELISYICKSCTTLLVDPIYFQGRYIGQYLTFLSILASADMFFLFGWCVWGWNCIISLLHLRHKTV